jgi:hypothetical protein
MAWEAGLDVMGFWEQVRTWCGERERCLYLDKLIGVPSCLRFRRWPSDVTAALFLCVRA